MWNLTLKLIHRAIEKCLFYDEEDNISKRYYLGYSNHKKEI